MSDMTIMILPINNKGIHWTLIMVTVNYTNSRKLDVHFYDPYPGRPYQTEI